MNRLSNLLVIATVMTFASACAQGHEEVPGTVTSEVTTSAVDEAGADEQAKPNADVASPDEQAKKPAKSPAPKPAQLNPAILDLDDDSLEKLLTRPDSGIQPHHLK